MISKTTKRKTKSPPSLPSPLVAALARARMLDRLADMELQHGHHLRAERLAHAAAALRGVSA